MHPLYRDQDLTIKASRETWHRYLDAKKDLLAAMDRQGFWAGSQLELTPRTYQEHPEVAPAWKAWRQAWEDVRTIDRQADDELRARQQDPSTMEHLQTLRDTSRSQAAEAWQSACDIAGATGTTNEERDRQVRNFIADPTLPYEPRLITWRQYVAHVRARRMARRYGWLLGDR